MPLPDAVLAAVGEDGAAPQADAASGFDAEAIEGAPASLRARLTNAIPDSPVRRVGVGLVAGALVVVALVVVVRRGGDEPLTGASASASSTTTSTSTTTTTEPEPVVSTLPPSTTTSAPPDFAGVNTGGLKLVYVDGPEAKIVDLDRNTLRRVHMPVGLGENTGDADHGAFPSSNELIASGRDVFFVAAGKAWALRVDVEADVVDLGPALALIGSTRPGHASILMQLGNDLVLRDLDARGRHASTSKPLPPDWRPVRSSSDVVVLAQGERQQLWNPQTGETVWTRDGPTAIAGATETHIVWQGNCELPVCAIHITDRATGADRTVLVGAGGPFPDGTRIRLDPTGRRFVVANSGGPDGMASGIEVHDMATGKVLGAGVPFVGFPLWSPDGRWLAITQFNGQVANRVPNLWLVEDDRLVSEPLYLPREASGGVVVITR